MPRTAGFGPGNPTDRCSQQPDITRRILLVWNRLIFPNGRSVVLERQPGTDAQGYAGLEDGIDMHWWDLAKAVGLSTLLSFSAELAMDNEDELIQALQGAAQDTINDAG